MSYYRIQAVGSCKGSNRETSVTIYRRYPLSIRGVQRILDKEDREGGDYPNNISVERVESWLVE